MAVYTMICFVLLAGCRPVGFSRPQSKEQTMEGSVDSQNSVQGNEQFGGSDADSSGEEAQTVESTIDLFQNIKICYDNWNGSSRATAVDTSECDDVIKELVRFEITDAGESLSNGDTISVIARYDADKLKQRGYVSNGDTRDIVVRGLRSISSDSHSYSDGVAWICAKEETDDGTKSTWVCCNKEGKILFSLPSDAEPKSDFYDGVALVSTEEEMYIVDQTGKQIWNSRENGFAAGEAQWGEGNITDVRITEWSCAKFLVKFSIESYKVSGTAYGILDKDGNWVYEPELDLFSGAYNEFIWKLKDDKIYNCDTSKTAEYSRDLIDEWIEEDDYSLHDGMLYDEVDDKKGFYNKDGKLVIDLSKYHLANEPEMNDGYALLEIYSEEGNSRYYTIIDKEGKEMFAPQQAISHEQLSEGFYWCNESEDRGYKNVQGQTAFGSDFSSGELFSNGLALVCLDSNGSYHFVNTDGNIVY